MRDAIGFWLEQSLVHESALAGILLHTCASGSALERVVVFYWPRLARGEDYWRTYAACAAIGSLSPDENLSRSICSRRRWESSHGRNPRRSGWFSVRSAGTLARGRAEHCGVGYDPRSGQLRPRVESGGVGEPAWSHRLAGGGRSRARSRAPVGCVGKLQSRRLAAFDVETGLSPSPTAKGDAASRVSTGNLGRAYWTTCIVFAVVGNSRPDKSRLPCICSRKRWE